MPNESQSLEIVPKQDGRKQRSKRSRDKIKSTIVELMQGGNYRIRAVDISQHSGLSMRTVFRHIDDMDSIIKDIAFDLRNELMPKLQKPYSCDEWRGQFNELIERRIEIFEILLPIRLTASLQRYRSKYLMREYEYLLELERKFLEEVLPSEIKENKTLFYSIFHISSISSWINLRMDQKLTPQDASLVVKQSLSTLVSDYA